MAYRTALPCMLLIAASLAACATSPRPQTLAANDEAGAAAACTQVTGSRIQSSQRAHCEPVGYPFRSFTRQQLEATGQIDLVEALRQLNPAFR